MPAIPGMFLLNPEKLWKIRNLAIASGLFA
jgi:hypothetical protein